jgi:hypothetical protein
MRCRPVAAALRPRSLLLTLPSPDTTRRVLRLASSALLIAILVLALFLSGVAGPLAIRESGSVEAAPQGMTLTVAAEDPGKSFAPGAVGLSIEAEELATRDLSSSHKSLVAFMRLLGPAVLRVGGNSLDYSWWTSDAEQPPVWATSVITPADLVSLRELLAATGWRVVLGVDLGHFDANRAADETRTAEHILGSRLLGIEIGNEPDLYATPSVKLRSGTYNVGTYLQELSSYTTAIDATSPETRLYGPELTVPTNWLTAIASDPRIPFAVLTEHYYPTAYNVPRGGCKGTSLPTALDLLSQPGRERENMVLQTLASAGNLAHRPTIISETNTTASCDDSGGPDTGPVFASSLWSLDWVLRAASTGVTGLNFHGYLGLCAPGSYSPLCAPSNGAEARGQVIAHPEYYGLLAARELEGGRFVPVDISGQNLSQDLTAYATVHPHGVITLAVDNFATERSVPLSLKVPGYAKATSEALTGPSIRATRGVTFGHASFNAVGVLRPTRTKVPRLDGGFRLALAPASAVIISLHR